MEKVESADTLKRPVVAYLGCNADAVHPSGRFETLAKLGGFFRPLALLPKNEVRTT